MENMRLLELPQKIKAFRPGWGTKEATQRPPTPNLLLPGKGRWIPTGRTLTIRPYIGAIPNITNTTINLGRIPFPFYLHYITGIIMETGLNTAVRILVKAENYGTMGGISWGGSGPVIATGPLLQTGSGLIIPISNVMATAEIRAYNNAIADDTLRTVFSFAEVRQEEE